MLAWWGQAGRCIQPHSGHCQWRASERLPHRLPGAQAKWPILEPQHPPYQIQTLPPWGNIDFPDIAHPPPDAAFAFPTPLSTAIGNIIILLTASPADHDRPQRGHQDPSCGGQRRAPGHCRSSPGKSPFFLLDGGPSTLLFFVSFFFPFGSQYPPTPFVEPLMGLTDDSRPTGISHGKSTIRLFVMQRQ